jgi:TRAP-type C4-dicarboxylate transport system substrate-binding protein
MNLGVWNKLPPDIQKILENYIGSAGSEYFGKEMDRSNETEKAKVQAMKDKTIIDLSPEETKRWKEACKPIWDKWVATVEAKGLPGKAVLEEAQKLSEKYLAEYKK